MCIVDNSPVDFVADAKRIQQDYLNSSSTSNQLSKSKPVAEAENVATATSLAVAASSNTNLYEATVISSTPSPDVMAVPANDTNTVPTTMLISPPSTPAFASPKELTFPVIQPPSPFASDSFSAEAAPVISTLRSVRRPQSTSTVFRAAPPTISNPTPAGVGPARTAAWPSKP